MNDRNTDRLLSDIAASPDPSGPERLVAGYVDRAPFETDDTTTTVPPACTPGRGSCRITVAGSIAVALMPSLHGDELLAATNRVCRALADELRRAASQPDLLAACERVMKDFGVVMAPSLAWDILRAALAKAKGGAA